MCLANVIGKILTIIIYIDQNEILFSDSQYFAIYTDRDKRCDLSQSDLNLFPTKCYYHNIHVHVIK